MSNRKLKAYRILPQSLYVKRKADRQLLSILDEMESPGYVLVARQMGKTNMLLYAKNSYETPSDVFVYIDLSNVFETSKECFRNIIDKAIDTNLDKIGMLQDQVLIKRSKQNIAAHLEHVQELRLILNSINGKVVIILDEIDALIKTNYSDEIFKQIRSVYFEGRSNYPEFKRLTYFLSGVIDPKEIIKDPRISPFNIGQKIFLDDFSIDEVIEFIERAELKIERKVVERIFYWTKGNPRILYDVCSELENATDSINETFIDTIVFQLYLKYFDKPPVDHIRELVEFDTSLRKAIFSIYENKLTEIPSEIKNKLYLAGIVNSDFSTGKLQLKNPIISESLNIRWLEQIERKKRSLIEIAIGYYKEREHQKAIELFEEYLQQKALNTLNEFGIFVLAACYYHTGKYDQAINYFNQVTYDKKGFATSYYEVKYFIGSSFYRLKEYDEAIKYFEEVTNYENHEYFYNAWTTLGGAYINSDFEKYKDKFFDRNSSLIADLEGKIENSKNSDFFNSILSTAYYNHAIAYSFLSDLLVSIEYLDKALINCKIEIKPAILFKKFTLSDNINDKKQILNGIIGFVISHNLKPVVKAISDLDFTYNLLDGLILESFNNDLDSNYILLDYIAKENIIQEFSSPEEILSTIGHYYFRNGKQDLGLKAFHKIVEHYGNRHVPVFIDASRNILINPQVGINNTLFQLYKDSVLKSNKTFDNYDQYIWGIYVSQALEEGEFLKASNLINAVLKSKVVESSTFNNVLFYYYRLNIQNINNDNKGALQSVNVIRKYLNQKVDFKRTNIFVKEELLKSIQLLVNQTIKEIDDEQLSVLKKIKEYGPNERVNVRYNDGTFKSQIKFKTVKNDYASGKCHVID